MTELFPDDPISQRLAEQILVAGRTIRAGEEEIRQKLAQEGQALHQGERTEAKLGIESQALTARMQWLYDHPMLRKGAGKVALTVMLEGSKLVTSPITDNLAQAAPGTLLTSGLVFSRHKGWKDNELSITRKVQDASGATSASQRLYRLASYRDRGRLHLEVENEHFQTYLEVKRKEITEAYVEANPWAESYTGWAHTFEATNGRHYVSYIARSSNDSKTLRNLRQLNEQLAPDMYPGNSWEYPDELFLEPLGMVREVSRLLGINSEQTVVE